MSKPSKSQAISSMILTSEKNKSKKSVLSIEESSLDLQYKMMIDQNKLSTFSVSDLSPGAS